MLTNARLKRQRGWRFAESPRRYGNKWHSPRPNAETLAAIQEIEDMISGKIPKRSYNSWEELMAEIDAEIAAEDAREMSDNA